jgi:hypothetical protein
MMFFKKMRVKSIGKKKPMWLLVVLLIPMVALALGAAVPGVWADDDDDDDELEFDEAKFNIEFNFSDEDLGVRAFVDGEPVRKVVIKGPKKEGSEKTKPIVLLSTKGGQKLQGIAELFFESGEPTLLDVSVQEFLDRFPEGMYEFVGKTTEGEKIEGEAEFTHVIPCGPAGLSASGNPPVISWDEVETVVDLDNSTSGDVQCIAPINGFEIVGYRVEVEWEEILNEGTEDEEEAVHTFGVDLAADQFQVTIPPEFLPADQEYDYEVLAIEASGNQTITEASATAP